MAILIMAMAMSTSCSAKNNSSGNLADTDVEMADNEQEVGESENDLDTAQAPGIKIGDNLRAVLTSASKVTYEYNADSGIWATIGNLSIVIDEDQLTSEGIDFIAAIPSDIAPDIDFKPEYVKPDATVQQIEVQ